MNARIFCVMLAAVLAFPVAAQTFPSKPVRIFVVYPPGGTSDAVTRLPHVGNVPYDALKDIAPLAGVMYSPVYLLATPAFTGKDFADLVAMAKAKPGSLRAGTSGIATLGHLMMEQLRIAAPPAVPTLTELGYPDSNYTSHFGFFAPAKTSEAVMKRLQLQFS